MSHALILFALSLTCADGPAPPHPTPAPVTPPPASLARTAPTEIWELTLRKAIRIGLDNSEIVRLVEFTGKPAPQVTQTSCGADPEIMKWWSEGTAKWEIENDPLQLVIAPVPINPRVGAWRFKAEVMAEIRSIEQQYWSLAQEIAQREACQKAVRLAEEILKREQEELEVGRGCVADIAEAQQRLDQLRLELVKKTADVLDTERRLRNLLGLPPRDDRTIVPVSVPTEARVEPDWASCLAAMLENQPDIAQQKAAIALVEKKLADAEASVALMGRLGAENLAPTPNEVRNLRETVKRERDFLGQVVNQTTHSLARFFLEIDANYKQFETARRFQTAAAKRLEAQRAFYEEGRITIDRYLDAVSQSASATAQEALFKASYNISLIALEEAKGTLLGYDRIAVADPPRPKSEPTRDDGARVASFESTPGNSHETPRREEAGKTVSFQFTVGAGTRPLEVRGSFTVTPTQAPSGR